MGGKSGKESQKPVDQILFNYRLEGPRIGFRYDSRPITLARDEGYVAKDPENPDITEGGENQNMVGASLNYVGSLNYQGYARINADPRTKKQWGEQGYRSFFWTAVIVRKGGYTFQWLLDNRITGKADRKKMEQLVLTRQGAEADIELKEIAARYSGQGISNIGTTEIVTEKIWPADILGYFEIREYTGDRSGETTTSLYTELKDLAEIEGYKNIPPDDILRYERFQATKGTIKPLSTFV